MDPSRGDSRYNLNYSMSSIGLSLADQADLYGNPAAAAALGGRPPSGGLIQSMGGGIGLSGRSSSGLMSNASQCQSLSNPSANNANNPGQQQQQQQSRGIKRTNSDCYDDHRGGGSSAAMAAQMQSLEGCAGGNGQQQQQQGGGNVPDVVDDSYNSMQNKKSPPANGKKTKGRVKIKMEYIDNKLRRYTTFSKRKTGIMKKAYELSTLTGTQVMLLVASETGHVYTFATRKLQPMITSEAGKQLIQTCLNSPDPPSVGGGDQRMSATGFEETELSYNIADEDSKDDRSPMSSGNETDDSSDIDSPGPSAIKHQYSPVVEPPPLGNISTAKNAISVPPTPSTTSISNSQTVPQCQPQKSLPPTPDTKLKDSIAAVPNKLDANNTMRSSTSNTSDIRPSSATYNNVMYPTSTLSNMPQEVLLQLLQSGHLQLHTEEDGSGHQYITIPLSMPSPVSSVSGFRNNTRNIAADVVNDLSAKSSLPDERSVGGTTGAPQSSSGELHIKQELLD